MVHPAFWVHMIPVLYSFRRCPYAMRARLALEATGINVHLREILLRDKPEAFLQASASATVPCLVTDTRILDESLDIMLWALEKNAAQSWADMPKSGFDWITRCDGPFKHALDRTKYGTRYPDEDPEHHRASASAFLTDLDKQITDWIFDHPTLADAAILPFVRQFAFIDKPWFDAQPWPSLQNWLERFLASHPFAQIMVKYVPWQPGDPPVIFPSDA